MIPKRECFEHFGEILLLNYLFWGDLGGLVAVICPDFVCVQENGRSRLVFADSGDWSSLAPSGVFSDVNNDQTFQQWVDKQIKRRKLWLLHECFVGGFMASQPTPPRP